MKTKKKFLCSLPWEHLSLHPHGHSSPCCEVDWASPLAFAKNKQDGEYTMKVLNVNDGIPAIVNSDSYKQIRKEMLDGEVPSACMTCYNLEEAGGHSKRNRETFLSEDFLVSITAEDGGITPNVKNVELRLGNFCNLKCRSCNAESSTSWINDYYKLKDEINLPSTYDVIKNAPDTDYTWPENPEFYEHLLKYTDGLYRLQISGGEPFLVDKHSHFLQLLIDNGIAKNVHVSYITNANYNFDKVSKKFFEKLKQFKSCSLSISIDDVGARNTYIRSLSNWNLTITNLKRFINEYPGFHYSVTQTINVFNFLYVEELSQFLMKEGLLDMKNRKPIFINDNYVFSPDYQSANVLPIEIRRKKIDSIAGKLPAAFYNRLKSNFYNSECNNLGAEFIKTTNAVDRVRREKIIDVFPKLYKTIIDEYKI
jgi:organic radical activating enzyme